MRPLSSTRARLQPRWVHRTAEERLQAAPVEHGLREALVHLERLRDPLELLAREVGEDRLRDRDERHLVRDRDDREAQPVGLFDTLVGTSA